MDGWIKLYRKLLNNDMWLSEKFTRGQAWVDLLLLANHDYGFFYCRDHKIEVQRGEVGVSALKLAARWQWSRTKVKKFLDDLEKEQQIVQQISKSYSVIRIVNYIRDQEKVQQEDNSETSEKHQEDTNKNDKNDKNDKKKGSGTKVPPSYEYLDSLLKIFKEEFKKNRGFEYIVTAIGKERSHISVILNHYRKVYPEFKQGQMKDFLREFFETCLLITDKFHWESMSPAHISSNLNKILSILTKERA